MVAGVAINHTQHFRRTWQGIYSMPQSVPKVLKLVLGKGKIGGQYPREALSPVHDDRGDI